MSLNLYDRARLHWRGLAVLLFAALAVEALVVAGPRLQREHASIRGEALGYADRIAEAKRLDLSYSAVAASPDSFAGRPVIWCIDSPSATSSYVAGRPSWPVALTARTDQYLTQVSPGGYCIKVLGEIVGRVDGQLLLRPLVKI